MLEPACTPPTAKRSFSRKRWVRIIVAALVLGGLSNYAVVWMLILSATPGSLFPVNHSGARETAPDFTFVSDEVVHEVTVEKTTVGVECAVWVLPDSGGANTREPKPLDQPPGWMVVPATLHHGDGTDGRGGASITWTNGYGFPAVCLMYTEAQLYDKTGAARLWKQDYWSFDVDFANGKRRLPLMPVWKGFLANTALYGVLWIGVLLLLGRCMRIGRASWAWIERRIEANARDTCRKCGYSRAGLLKENAPCPECGHKPF